MEAEAAPGGQRTPRNPERRSFEHRHTDMGIKGSELWDSASVRPDAGRVAKSGGPKPSKRIGSRLQNRFSRRVRSRKDKSARETQNLGAHL